MIVSQYYCDLCHVQIHPERGWEHMPSKAILHLEYPGQRQLVREQVCVDCVARLITAFQPLPKPEAPTNA